MAEPASPFLTAWSNFYIMTGSSAASLTGLMFVVITLVTGERLRKSPDGLSTFSTPTVLHFGAALLVSATLAAPWRSLVPPSVLLGFAGLFGIVYVLRIMYRTRRLRSYVADWEDWIFYSILPFVAYVAIFAGAIALTIAPERALFAIGGGVIVLIFDGIHNAWDIVTFIATGQADDLPDEPLNDGDGKRPPEGS